MRQDLRHLNRLVGKLKRDEMRRLRARVGRLAIRVGREALQRDGDPSTGRPWAAQKRDLGHPVLRASGEMLRARIVRYKRQGEYRIKVFFTAKKSFTSKRFWVHQKGHSKRRMPARPHIGFAGADMDRIQQESLAAVRDGLNGG